MHDETRNTIYLALSLIIAAITLSAIAYVLHIRADFASTRYDEMYSQKRAETNRKFSMYNSNELTGSEVVAMIRNYYTDSSIDIFVDRDKFGNSFLLDGTTRDLDYTTAANRNAVSTSFTLNDAGLLLALGKCGNYILAEKALSAIFDVNQKYTSYLIYDGNSVKDFSKAGKHENNSIVTGIYVRIKY